MRLPLQKLRRWHWMAIGLAVGIVLAYMLPAAAVDESIPTIGREQFEQGLLIAPGQANHLTDLAHITTSDGREIVLATQLRLNRATGAAANRRVAYVASGGDIEQIRAQHPQLTMTRATQRDPWITRMIWIGGCLIVVGGAWPILISLLTGNGFGLRRRATVDEYDLSRFQPQATEPTPPPKRQLSPQELAHLRQIEAELERGLAGGDAGAASPMADSPSASTPAIASLTAGPLEAPVLPSHDDAHDYRGEYYPVDRHVRRDAPSRDAKQS